MIFATASPATPAFASEQVLVPMDEARIIRLNRAPTTVIVGNPLIADVTVQDERLLVVVGKTYGTTNIIALDENGEELSSLDVSVRTGGNNNVQVFYGDSRTSYTCAPRCERRIEIGDEVSKFDVTTKQASDKIKLYDRVAGK
ncbi:MAG: pilus assembly protein N-terminal domain-containing protein [Hyphomicrobiales bacterium]